jgi:lipopolysaccharide biosynthesis regulator YciM
MRHRLSDSLCLKIDPALRSKIQATADQREMSMSELARVYIQDGLARDKAEA